MAASFRRGKFEENEAASYGTPPVSCIRAPLTGMHSYRESVTPLKTRLRANRRITFWWEVVHGDDSVEDS